MVVWYICINIVAPMGPTDCPTRQRRTVIASDTLFDCLEKNYNTSYVTTRTCSVWNAIDASRYAIAMTRNPNLELDLYLSPPLQHLLMDQMYFKRKKAEAQQWLDTIKLEAKEEGIYLRKEILEHSTNNFPTYISRRRQYSVILIANKILTWKIHRSNVQISSSAPVHSLVLSDSLLCCLRLSL